MGQVSVFARVLPQQKLQLVRTLQALGEVVAMGQRGTAVARESADRARVCVWSGDRTVIGRGILAQIGLR